MLCGDPETRRLARLPSWEYDGHSDNAKLIFGASESDPDWKQKRHLGKIVSHGAQRDMRGKKLSGSILKELELFVSPEKCDTYLDAYHAKFPGIRDVYFRDVRRTIMRDRILVNSWGRCIDFRYDRLDDEIFRQGYSFRPQSEVADLMNMCGVYPTWQYMMGTYGWPPNVTVHDSLLCSVPAKDAYDVASFIERQLKRPLILGGEKLVIPVEYKLGINWAGQHEFKRLPSKKEFTDIAMSLECQS